MNKAEANNLIKLLDWKHPKKDQLYAIEKLSKIEKEFYFMLFNWNAKSTWENAVTVIGNLGFPNNKPLFRHLIWLMKDVNWPGAQEAIKILSNISDRQYLLEKLEEYIELAFMENDTMWLGGLKCVVNAAGFWENDFSSGYIFHLLDDADF